MLPDEMLRVIRQWIDRAEEKYLKALLVFRSIDFPKTHNIPELFALVPASIRPPLSAEEQEQLTDYATVLRYPGDWEPITRKDAQAAVEVARRVREAVRGRLPDAA